MWRETLALKLLMISMFQNLNDMVAMERPDWQAVMTYVTSIYKHFEVDTKQAPCPSPSPSS